MLKQTNTTANNINDAFVSCVSVQYCIKVETSKRKEFPHLWSHLFPLFVLFSFDGEQYNRRKVIVKFAELRQSTTTITTDKYMQIKHCFEYK